LNVVALIPIKPRAQCKQRLVGALSQAQRLALVRTMLGRVIAAAWAAPGIDEVALLTTERDLAPGDLRLIRDRGHDLNGALEGALDQLAAGGADAFVVLPADLPFVTAADIARLAAIARSGGAALSPDEAERGTNALAAPVRSDIIFAFGPDSFRAHQCSLRSIGLAPVIVRSPGLAFDLDEPQALARVADLIGIEPPLERGSHIRAFGLAARASALTPPPPD
jgi:2-phospho-L-lactate guanylyltransferase